MTACLRSDSSKTHIPPGATYILYCSVIGTMWHRVQEAYGDKDDRAGTCYRAGKAFYAAQSMASRQRAPGESLERRALEIMDGLAAQLLAAEPCGELQQLYAKTLADDLDVHVVNASGEYPQFQRPAAPESISRASFVTRMYRGDQAEADICIRSLRSTREPKERPQETVQTLADAFHKRCVQLFTLSKRLDNHLYDQIILYLCEACRETTQVECSKGGAKIARSGVTPHATVVPNARRATFKSRKGSASVSSQEGGPALVF